jgi:hypothetical protein
VLATPALAAPGFAAGKGTDILHLTLRTNLAANQDPDAEGSLSLSLRQQGGADVQKLRLDVSGLEAGATYQLFPQLRDGTVPTDFPTFDTDEHGEASLKLMHIGHGNGSGKNFPADLDPLTDVLALEIRSEDGTVVALDADLTNPDSLQYLVKRRLDNAGADPDAEGLLSLKQHGSKALFRLKASNLAPSGGYTLAINCADVVALDCEYVDPSLTADARGRLDIEAQPGMPAPFDMTQVVLIDATNQLVLSTELP